MSKLNPLQRTISVQKVSRDVQRRKQKNEHPPEKKNGTKPATQNRHILDEMA